MGSFSRFLCRFLVPHLIKIVGTFTGTSLLIFYFCASLQNHLSVDIHYSYGRHLLLNTGNIETSETFLVALVSDILTRFSNSISWR